MMPELGATAMLSSRLTLTLARGRSVLVSSIPRRAEPAALMRHAIYTTRSVCPPLSNKHDRRLLNQHLQAETVISKRRASARRNPDAIH